MNAMLQAFQLRDEGMARAIDNAQDGCFDWPDRAYAFLVAYAKANATFSSEQVSEASRSVRHFPQPSTDRAWGSIYSKAARNGVIRHGGIARRTRGHASIGILWQSLVHEGDVA